MNLQQRYLTGQHASDFLAHMRHWARLQSVFESAAWHAVAHRRANYVIESMRLPSEEHQTVRDLFAALVTEYQARFPRERALVAPESQLMVRQLSS